MIPPTVPRRLHAVHDLIRPQCVLIWLTGGHPIRSQTLAGMGLAGLLALLIRPPVVSITATSLRWARYPLP